MIRILIIFITAFILLTTVANAGVTIHYEGTATSNDSITKILKIITNTANKNKWKIEDASTIHGHLGRVINEKDNDYDGKVKGIVVYINENCEPLFFQFGDDLFMQNYVKTQYAGADVHIQIIHLLDDIHPYFKTLKIEDEGEFWEKRDKLLLEKHIKTVDSMINEVKKKNPKAQGPFKIKDGRIIDLIQ